MPIDEHNSDEEWRDVPGYEGLYQVSNHGRVKSLPRKLPGIRHFPGGILRLNQRKDGYRWFSLRKDGKPHQVLVHRTVLLAFVGPPTEKQVCRHLDGDPHNDHLSNLCWGTYKENSADIERHGRRAKGEKSGPSKVTEEDVLNIRRLYATGRYTQLQLAKHFGLLSQMTVSSIVRRRNWRHI